MATTTRAVVAGVGSTVPAGVTQDELWKQAFAGHLADDPVARRLWRRAGVEHRHAVAVPPDDDVRTWSTQARMRRFVESALPLGKEAVGAALAEAGVDAGEVDLLAVATCTGYANPGIDVFLARDLALRPSTERVLIGHMGCYAALPGLGVVADAAVARDTTAVLLCVELSSLHAQPPTRDLDQVVAHALFADAAAAVVVRPSPLRSPDGGRRSSSGSNLGLEVVDLVAHTDPEHAPLLTWDVTDRGFRMGLSAEVPEAVAAVAPSAVTRLLSRHGLTTKDVEAWAVHPGGPKILDMVEDRLGLGTGGLAESRAVLREYGNCSSPTVLLVLERILRRDLERGDFVVCLAFGAGLTVYAALLRCTGS